MTDAERAQAGLSDDESGYRELLLNAATAIVMSDAAGGIVFANRSAASLLGYQRTELVGSSIDRIVPERHRVQHHAYRVGTLAGAVMHESSMGEELSAIRRDGTEVPIAVSLSPMQSGDRPLLVCFIRDLSEQRAAEGVVRAYQERLKRMAFEAALSEERERRRIAIDLHDRIAQTLALAQMKLGSARSPDSAARDLAVESAIELIEQSIRDTRGLCFELSPPILYDLGFGAALHWLSEDLEQRHGLRVELGDSTSQLRLDPARAALLFRAVRELLMHVLKHAKTSSAELRVRQVGTSIEIDVIDAGCGFDVSELRATNPEHGFGLFSVREQLGLLGGTLLVRSEPGSGTLVGINLPIGEHEPGSTGSRP